MPIPPLKFLESMIIVPGILLYPERYVEKPHFFMLCMTHTFLFYVGTWLTILFRMYGPVLFCNPLCM